jgi:MFS family permease
MELAARFGAWRTSDNRAYLVLLALGALDAAGYSVIAPVLPSISRELNAGPALIGVLVASFPAAMMPASPPPVGSSAAAARRWFFASRSFSRR